MTRNGRRLSVLMAVLIAAALFALLARERRSELEKSTRSVARSASTHDSSVRNDGDRAPIDSNRAPAIGDSVALESLVSIASGSRSPIHVVWIPLPADDEASIASWPEADWRAIDAGSFAATCDSRGAFKLDVPRAVIRARSSVLWITHPDCIAKSLILSPCTSDAVVPSVPARIQLEPGGPLTATVVDPNGRPLSGATVYELFDLEASEPESSDARELAARRVFHCIQTTGDDGRAVLSPLGSKHRIYATSGDLISSPQSGRAPAHVVLQLAAVFLASGHAFPPANANIESGVGVRCLLETWSDETTLDRCAVGSDGSWGPLRVPLIGGGHYVFQLEGGRFVQERKEVNRPQPGEHINIDFHPQTGVGLTIKVIDDKDDAVAGADVTVLWNTDQVWQERARKSDAAGLARIDGCRAGALWVRARHPGFVPGLISSIDATSVVTEPVTVRLAKGGRIQGHCLHGEQPVTDFTVTYFQGQPDNPHRLRVQGSADGSFSSDEVEIGDVVFTATSENFPQCIPTTAHVDPDRTSDIVISVLDPTAGHGRVVDSETQEPVLGAMVQAYVTYRGWMVKLWKEPVRVDTQGDFELHAFGPGTNYVRILADGYAPREVQALAVSGRPLEFGDIGLYTTQSLDVQLVSDESTDFAMFKADLQRTTEVDLRPFPRDGHLRFEALSPGPYDLRVVFPDTSAYFEKFEIFPGKNVKLIVPVSGRGLDVEFVPEAGMDIPHWAYLNVHFMSAEGRSVGQYYGLTDLKPVHVHRAEGTTAVLEVQDMKGAFLGVKEVPLTGQGTIAVEIPIRRSQTCIRVVDSARRPLSDVHVTLSGVGDNAAWRLLLDTDTNGQCCVSGLGIKSVFVHLQHASIGIAPSQLIDLPTASSTPAELVLAPQRPLAIQLIEGSRPTPGVEVLLSDARGIETGLGDVTSDENGVVAGPLVSDGDYRVEIHEPGYWRCVHTVHLPGNGPPVPVAVKRLGSLELTVHNGYDNPAGGVAVDLYSTELKEWASTWIRSGAVPSATNDGESDAQGLIRWNALPSGEFQWRCISTSGATVKGAVAVSPGTVSKATITIP